MGVAHVGRRVLFLRYRIVEGVWLPTPGSEAPFALYQPPPRAKICTAAGAPLADGCSRVSEFGSKGSPPRAVSNS